MFPTYAAGDSARLVDASLTDHGRAFVRYASEDRAGRNATERIAFWSLAYSALAILTAYVWPATWGAGK
jgi:hypothetical protein